MGMIRNLIEGILGAFYALPDWLAMTIISALCGVVALWVVGLVLPACKLRRSRDRMLAALYELRLYFDSPRRVFGAQGRMIGWSLIYTAWIGLPMLVLAIPFGLLFLHLEARHGLDPLPTNQPILMRVDIDEACDGKTVEIEPGDGVTIETPPLYDRRADAVYQTVSVAEPGDYEVVVDGCGVRESKRLDAQVRDGSYSPARVGQVAMLWSLTDEAPLSGPIERIKVEHPAADQIWFGVAMAWWIYWLIATTVVAMALQKPMRVEL